MADDMALRLWNAAMSPHRSDSAGATTIAVLLWSQIAVHIAVGASAAIPRMCPSRAGPSNMVVVAAPTPYYSWVECKYDSCAAIHPGCLVFVGCHDFKRMCASGWCTRCTIGRGCSLIDCGTMAWPHAQCVRDQRPGSANHKTLNCVAFVAGNAIMNAGEGYGTEPINKTRHAGVVTLL